MAYPGLLMVMYHKQLAGKVNELPSRKYENSLHLARDWLWVVT